MQLTELQRMQQIYHEKRMENGVIQNLVTNYKKIGCVDFYQKINQVNSDVSKLIKFDCNHY